MTGLISDKNSVKRQKERTNQDYFYLDFGVIGVDEDGSNATNELVKGRWGLGITFLLALMRIIIKT